MKVPEAIMQMPGSDTAGPESDILWPDSMSVDKDFAAHVQ